MSKFKAFEDKIDTPEKFNAAWRAVHHIIDGNKYDGIIRRLVNMRVGSATTHDYERAEWWAKREAVRIVHVYPEQPDILANVIAHFENLRRFFPHPSMSTPGGLAYTASEQDGQRDIQKTTTIGRFLRKNLMLVTDAWIQAVEQQWASEMDPSFQLATTPEDIIKVYMDTNYVASCMRYHVKSDNFPAEVREYGLHPTGAYASPGMGVAYLTNGDGHVTARCVVWVNPDNQNDKRMVRLYGAPQLEAKLKRAGYKWASLSGAKLTAIELKTTPDGGVGTYLCPYMDAVQGSRGDTSIYGFIDESDPGFIQLIEYGEYSKLPAKLRSPEYSFAGMSITSGLVHLKKIRMLGARFFTCFVTKEKIDTWTSPYVYEYELKTGRAFASVDCPPGKQVVVARDENMVVIRVLSDEADALTTTTADGVRVLNRAIPAMVARGSLLPLTEKYYPKGAMATASECATYNGTTMLHSDSILVIRPDAKTRVHKAELTAQVDNGDVIKLHKASSSGQDIYATKDHPDLRTTDTGRHVLLGHHRVVECVDGVTRFERSATMVSFLGYRVWVAQNVAVGAAQLPAEHVSAQLTRTLTHIRESYSTNRARLVRLNSILATAALTPASQGSLFDYGDGSPGPRINAKTAAENIAALFQAAQTVTNHSAPYNSRCKAWAGYVTQMRPTIEAALVEFGLNDTTTARPVTAELPAIAEELLGPGVVEDLRRRITALATTIA